MSIFVMFNTAEEYEVLMLLHSGGGISIRDAWLDISDISSLKRHHRNITLREIIMDGDYRTDLNVDQLPIDEVSCPISLESTDMHQPNDRVKPVYQVAFQKG